MPTLEMFKKIIPPQSKMSWSWQGKQESKLEMMTSQLHIACDPALVSQYQSLCVLLEEVNDRPSPQLKRP